MSRRPKFVRREVTRHGKPVWYFRRSGPRIRLPDEFGSTEWWAAYQAALDGRDIPKSPDSRRGDSFAGLVDRYIDSRVFGDFAKNTRQQRATILRAAADKAGDSPISKVTESSIRQVMQSRPPYAANNFLKSVRGMFKWAMEMGYAKSDPTYGVKMNRRKTDGHIIWTPEALGRFREHWDLLTPQRICFELALATGLRRSDLISLAPHHLITTYNNSGLNLHVEIVAKKTKVKCYIPATQVEHFPERGETEPFITRESGKPFPSAETLGNWFRKACVEAGIPEGMRLHSLRKTAATMDAHNGWSANRLMAKYGWLDIKEAELYTRQADRKKLALGA